MLLVVSKKVGFKKRGFYEDFKQLASDGKLKINSAQIASKDSSGANIEPVTPRKPTPDNNDKSTSKDKLPGSGDESSDSILLDPSKPPSIQNIIHPDLMDLEAPLVEVLIWLEE